MSKKAVKHRTHGERVTAVEVAARKEQMHLRRLRNQQRAIRDLSRQLRRAVSLADRERDDLAVALATSGGYRLLPVKDWEILHDDNARLRQTVEELRAQLGPLQLAAAAGTV